MTRYALRDMREDDLPLVLSWRNERRVSEFMFTGHEIAWDEHVAWFRRMGADSNAAQLVFEIDGHPVGVVGFTGLGDPGGVASWGFYIGDDTAPKGSGSRMLAFALDHVFALPGIVALDSEVIAANRASRRAHERLGFRNVGLMQHSQEGSGDTEVVVYAITANEWRIRRRGVLGTLFEDAGGGPE